MKQSPLALVAALVGLLSGCAHSWATVHTFNFNPNAEPLAKPVKVYVAEGPFPEPKLTAEGQTLRPPAVRYPPATDPAEQVVPRPELAKLIADELTARGVQVVPESEADYRIDYQFSTEGPPQDPYPSYLYVSCYRMPLPAGKQEKQSWEGLLHTNAGYDARTLVTTLLQHFGSTFDGSEPIATDESPGRSQDAG